MKLIRCLTFILKAGMGPPKTGVDLLRVGAISILLKKDMSLLTRHPTCIHIGRLERALPT